METRKPTILVVLGATAALSYHLATRARPETVTVTTNTQDSQRLENLERMLKEQQRKVALVATQAPRPTVTRASEPEFPEGDEQQPPAQTTAPSTQEAARTFEQVIDELDDSFQVESRDLAWSGRAEPEVRSQIQLASVEGTRVTAIDCHTTLCRADLVHPSLERHRNFLDSLINHRKWPGEMTINTADKSPDAINENEPVSAVVFFKRGNP